MPPRPLPDSPLAPLNRHPRRGLTHHQETALKAKLRKSTPSEPWVEDQLKTALFPDRHGQPRIYRYHDPAVFPPGGPKTLMRTCPLCHVPNPPQTFDADQCFDHAEDLDFWGPSPSALAIEKLQFYYLRESNLDIDTDLPSEDYRDLRREIEDYHAKLQKSRPGATSD